MKKCIGVHVNHYQNSRRNSQNPRTEQKLTIHCQTSKYITISHTLKIRQLKRNQNARILYFQYEFIKPLPVVIEASVLKPFIALSCAITLHSLKLLTVSSRFFGNFSSRISISSKIVLREILAYKRSVEILLNLNHIKRIFALFSV